MMVRKSIVLLAFFATLIFSQDPEEIAKALQQAETTKSDSSLILKKIPIQTLKKCCESSLPSPLFENFQTITSLPNVDYYQMSGAPIPGYYSLTASGASGLAPWAFHQCPKQGKHLYVNGITTNWNGYYRRIYTYSGTLPKGVTYRFCFKIRNLPECSPWDKKPWGYISGPTLYNYWNVDVLNLTGCNWKDVVSNKFVGTGLPTTVSIYLYNGWYGEGNDLVIDNVQIVTLNTQPIPLFFPALGSYNGFTYSFMVSSSNLPSDNCLDYWYLYQGLTLVSSGVATPSTSIQFTIPGLQVGIKYTVKIKRVCDCSTDAFWSTSFIVYGKTADTAVAAGKLNLSETSDQAFKVEATKV